MSNVRNDLKYSPIFTYLSFTDSQEVITNLWTWTRAHLIWDTKHLQDANVSFQVNLRPYTGSINLQPDQPTAE